jgi:hypothetical protein
MLKLKVDLNLNTRRKHDWEKVKNLLARIDVDKAQVQSAILKRLSEGPLDTHDLIDYLRTHEVNASKTTIHKTLKDLRDRLEHFYHSPDGFQERFRLEMPKYARLQSITVAENIPPQDATGFWAAHLGNGLPTKLIMGGSTLRIENEILFKDSDGEVLKHWTEDNPRAEDAAGEFETLVAIPNVRAMIHLFNYFRHWHEEFAQPAPELFACEGPRGDAATNRIILGTPFDNDAILDNEVYAEHRNHSCLFFNADGTRFRKTAANGEYRVWVVRRWPRPNFETTIAASDASALNVVCEVLTSKALGKLVRKLWGERKWKGFPPEFRIEFRVKVAENGTAESVRVNSYQEMEGWGRKVGPSGKSDTYFGPGREWTSPW